MQHAAAEVVGRVKNIRKGMRFTDTELEQLSKRHQELRMELLCNKRVHATEEAQKLIKNKMSKLSHARERRVRALESEKLDKIAANVVTLRSSIMKHALLQQSRSLRLECLIKRW